MGNLSNASERETIVIKVISFSEVTVTMTVGGRFDTWINRAHTTHNVKVATHFGYCHFKNKKKTRKNEKKINKYQIKYGPEI